MEQLVPAELYALGPDEFRAVVPLERAGPSDFEAKIPIGERFGLFRVRPAPGFDRFPEVAFYRNNRELADTGSNPDLLRRIAQLTGGRFNPIRGKYSTPAAGRQTRRLISGQRCC